MKYPIVTLTLMVLPIVTSAHHSRAEFSGETQEISGELLAVDWSNPHPVFTLRIDEQDDMEGIWEIQGYGSIYTLTRAGVTGDHFSVGDQVKVKLSKFHELESPSAFSVNSIRTPPVESG